MNPINQDTKYLAIQASLVLFAMLAGIGVGNLLLRLL